MVSTNAIAVVGVLLALAPWFYERGQLISMFIKNRPGQLPSKNSFSTYQVLYEDTVRNCEHGLLDEASGLALLSCDPGRDNWNTVMGQFLGSHEKQGDIFVYHYASAGSDAGSNMRKLDRSSFPANRDFHPLGMDYHKPSGRLFVVNHALPLTIEIFKLSLEAEKLTYESTFQHPNLNAPNSVYAINDEELFVTNDHYIPAHTNKYASLAESYLGLPGGSVNYVNLATKEVKPLARLPCANGVVQLNSSHLAVASTTGADVRIFAWEPVNKTLSLKERLRVPFLPDNLSRDSAGNLLVAGHPFPPALEVMAKTNYQYALDGPDPEKKSASERPRSPSAAMLWDGNGEGKLQTLYVGDDYDAACTALRDVKRKTGILLGLYAKGVLVWKE